MIGVSGDTAAAVPRPPPPVGVVDDPVGVVPMPVVVGVVIAGTVVVVDGVVLVCTPWALTVVNFTHVLGVPRILRSCVPVTVTDPLVPTTSALTIRGEMPRCRILMPSSEPSTRLPSRARAAGRLNFIFHR